MAEAWKSSLVNRIDPDDSDEIIEKKLLNQKLVADKYPYFFIYNYTSLKRQYDKFCATASIQANINFNKSIEQIINDAKNGHVSEEEKNFLYWYNKKIPVNTSPSMMNRLCWQIEDKVHKTRLNNSDFDYTLLMHNKEVDEDLYKQIELIYKEYLYTTTTNIKSNKESHTTDQEIESQRRQQLKYFLYKCSSVCPNAQTLSDIVIKLCYQHNNSKQFAWEMCGTQIIYNLLEKNNFKISYPELDVNGEIQYNGLRFSMKTIIPTEEMIKEMDEWKLY